jgi:hypothetical protein
MPSRRTCSDRINDILAGKVKLEEEEASIQSACAFEIYKISVEILALPDRQARHDELTKVPELLRPYVQAEVIRVWQYRTGRSVPIAPAGGIVSGFE